MVSIRRTLSPARKDRSHINGMSSFSSVTLSHKFIDGSRQQSMQLSPFPNEACKFFKGIFFPQRRFKGLHRFIFRVILFFILGFMMGMIPFGSVGDIRSSDVSCERITVKLDNEDESIDSTFLDKKNFEVERRVGMEDKIDLLLPLKQLIIVTPTYNRGFQAFYLSRLGQVLKLVKPPLLWIVVEMRSASVETSKMLWNSGVMYRHLSCTRNSTSTKDRGFHQRITALKHIEHHKIDGIVYFADDDNIYSLELFESLRGVRRFGTWPVATVFPGRNKAIVEGVVCNGSIVMGWHTSGRSKRLHRFHVDMSGFAFNTSILWDSRRKNLIRQLDTFNDDFQETTFIEQMIEDEEEMEGIPVGCKSVMNWHLQIEPETSVKYPTGDWLLPNNLPPILNIM